jgi:hypothetical protein
MAAFSPPTGDEPPISSPHMSISIQLAIDEVCQNADGVC